MSYKHEKKRNYSMLVVAVCYMPPRWVVAKSFVHIIGHDVGKV